MTAPEIYRKWMSDYKFEKQITSKEPIEDGDILDWLAEKQAKNILLNPSVSGSLPLIEIKGEWYDAGLIKKVSRSGNYTNVWIGKIGGCPKQVWDENSELLNRILAVRQ